MEKVGKEGVITIAVSLNMLILQELSLILVICVFLTGNMLVIHAMFLLCLFFFSHLLSSCRALCGMLGYNF
jgi:hypothetical protein